MLGSASSIALPNTVLNTAVAESLKQFADQLEGAEDFTSALHELIRKEIKDHKRIIFNGNGYDDSWIAEAEARGLSNLKTTPDAVKHYLDEKNVALFTSHKVYSEVEMQSRHEVFLEKYTKLIDIEAKTMLEMAKQDILPAVSAYSSELAGSVTAKTSVLGSAPAFEQDTLKEISEDMKAAYEAYLDLEEDMKKSKDIDDLEKLADFIKDDVLSDMASLRASCDKLEAETAADYWPFPTYGDLLFAVR